MAERHVHLRHKPPTPLDRPRELVIACPEMQSNVNLSRIVRAAGCCGVTKIIAAGSVRIDRKIARDALDQIEIESRRTLLPTLKRIREETDAVLVGLEQAEGSVSLPEFSFPRNTVLVIGHERKGIEPEVLKVLHHVVEIPVWGMPYSYNAATATVMALYEYCRQYPRG
ncbi:MAG: hypothetical protein KDB14_32565 [Planctomycetales bacterium]|nr:hypothetical protein [Planctomycetales bacterium]